MRRLALLSSSLWLVLSCSPVPRQVKYELEAPCPERVYMTVTYCQAKHAYSGVLQHLSRVEVISLETGKSLTIAVRKDERVRGLCIPEEYRGFMSRGSSFKGEVRVLRCGENGERGCPKYIRGYASWYGPEFHSRTTTAGTNFNMYDYVAAHRTLPLGTVLLVKNLENGKTVTVTVLDRGPFAEGRHLDLSYGAAKELGMLSKGTVPFVAEVVRCGS